MTIIVYNTESMYWFSCMHCRGDELPYRLSEWQQRCSRWGTCRHWACRGKSAPAGWQRGVQRPYTLLRWSSGCCPAASQSQSLLRCQHSVGGTACQQPRRTVCCMLGYYTADLFGISIFLLIMWAVQKSLPCTQLKTQTINAMLLLTLEGVMWKKA